MRLTLLATLALGALLPWRTEAACRCTFVDGRQQQLCESSIDLPALCPAALAPLVPLSLPPLQLPSLPPLGTSSCRQAQVWNGQSYVWQEVCQ